MPSQNFVYVCTLLSCLSSSRGLSFYRLSRVFGLVAINIFLNLGKEKKKDVWLQSISTLARQSSLERKKENKYIISVKESKIISIKILKNNMVCSLYPQDRNERGPEVKIAFNPTRRRPFIPTLRLLQKWSPVKFIVL